jgi:hypothetical protein
MILNLKELKYYYLTLPTSLNRIEHMNSNFSDLNVKQVNPIANVSRHQSCASGFCRILDLALRNQDRTKPFQPFVIMEDDVSKYREFSNDIQIPDNTDILFIGITSCGWNCSIDCFDHNIYCESINNYPHLVKVYNMLSQHGNIICSASGAIALQKAMLDAFHKNIPTDVPLAKIQPYYNVYSLIEPLLYQDAKVGGQEEATKSCISLELLNHIVPEYQLNKKLLNYQLCYKE